jgi:hypothetical protein
MDIVMTICNYPINRLQLLIDETPKNSYYLHLLSLFSIIYLDFSIIYLGSLTLHHTLVLWSR